MNTNKSMIDKSGLKQKIDEMITSNLKTLHLKSKTEKYEPPQQFKKNGFPYLCNREIYIN